MLDIHLGEGGGRPAFFLASFDCLVRTIALRVEGHGGALKVSLYHEDRHGGKVSLLPGLWMEMFAGLRPGWTQRHFRARCFEWILEKFSMK